MQREAGSFLQPRWHETWYVALAGLELAAVRVLCLQACHEALRRLFLALEVRNSPCIYGMALAASLTQGDASPEPAGRRPDSERRQLLPISPDAPLATSTH